MKYPLGEYNRQVAIQAKPNPTTANQLREETAESAEPRDVAFRWVRIEAVGGKESVQAAQWTAAVTHRINIAFAFTELTPRHRIRHGNRIFNIESMGNLNDIGTEQELMCIEDVSGST